MRLPAVLLALVSLSAAPGKDEPRPPPAQSRDKPPPRKQPAPEPPPDQQPPPEQPPPLPDPDAELVEHLDEIEKLELLLNLEFFEPGHAPAEEKKAEEKKE